MKKVKIALVALTLAAFAFDGCKKGADDPFMSIHSRKGRLAGDWKISAGSGTDVSGTNTSTWSYDGAIYTQTSGTITTTTNITWTLNFEKDGTYKQVMTTTATNYNDVQTETGTWNFTSGIGDNKNKDRVVLMTLSFNEVQTIASNTTTTNTTYAGDNAPTSNWYLDELKNKEVIFSWDGSTTDASGTDTSKGTYTLTPQ